MIDHFTSKEINLVPVLIQLIFINICVFFFFFVFEKSVSQSFMCIYTIHGTHKLLFSTKFSLKIGPTILFTYLKIILLQYF